MPDEEKKEETSPDPREPKPKGTDYTQAAKGRKQQPGEEAPEKKEITAVVDSSSVTVQKRGIGSKIKDLFVAADLRSVMHFIGYDIILPAARSMIVDSASKGVERIMYGPDPRRGTPGTRSRFSYQTPVSREGFRDPRTNPPDRSRFPRAGRNDYILQSRQEAELVVEELYNLLGVYEHVSVAELKEVMGLPSVHTDHKWGWYDLRGTNIRPIRDGFLIDLPPEEQL